MRTVHTMFCFEYAEKKRLLPYAVVELSLLLLAELLLKIKIVGNGFEMIHKGVNAI